MIDNMRPGPDLNIVRPRQSREGWSLESDRLSHGRFWYENEAQAREGRSVSTHLLLQLLTQC
jgi:hypothetical protein